MDIVKKNLVSIICGVVALLAVVAVFVWPLSGWYSELDREVQARKSVHSSVTSLLGTNTQLPKLSDEAEPITLERFPTRSVIAAGKEAAESLKTQSELLYKRAEMLNARPLLLPGLLPNPSRSVLINFRQRYIDVMWLDMDRRPFAQAASWIGKTGSLGKTPSGQDITLNGTMPPTEQEISQARANKEAEVRSRLTRLNAQGQVDNAAEVQAAVQAAIATLARDLRDVRAKSGKVYIDPTALSPITTIKDQTPNDVTAFDAQVNLWVHQAFLSGIARANARASNVLDAPVKHLLKLEVPLSFVPVPAGGGGMAMPGAPTPEISTDVPIDPTAELPKNPLQPTQRTHNPLYDPVRFRAILRIEAGKLPAVLTDLQRDQFITVTNVASIVAVDSTAQLGFGYNYGSGSIIEVKLEMEMLFLRKWLVQLMPPSVRAALLNAGQTPDASGVMPPGGFDPGMERF
jgi:hypothetical protein